MPFFWSVFLGLETQSQVRAVPMGSQLHTGSLLPKQGHFVSFRRGLEKEEGNIFLTVDG